MLKMSKYSKEVLGNRLVNNGFELLLHKDIYQIIDGDGHLGKTFSYLLYKGADFCE